MSASARDGLWSRAFRVVRSNSKFGRYLRGSVAGFLAAVVVLLLRGGNLLENYELRTLDWRIRTFTNPESRLQTVLRQSAKPGLADLALISVDDLSVDYIRAIGQPWPPRRTLWGDIARYCHAGGARAVVYDVTYAERSAFTMAAEEYGLEGPTDDELFAQALQESAPVFLGASTVDQTRATAEHQDFVAPAQPVQIRLEPDAVVPRAYVALSLPVPPIGAAASGIGTVLVLSDQDGVKRRYVPFVLVNGKPHPSLGMLVAAHMLGVREITVRAGSLEIGDHHLRLDQDGLLQLNFRVPWSNPNNVLRSAYPYTTLKAVHESIVATARNRDLPPGEQVPVPFPAEAFRDKVVFLGYSANDLGDLHALPVGSDAPGVFLHMTAVDNVLAADPLHRNSSAGLIAGVLFAGTLTGLLVALFTAWRGPAAGIFLVVVAWYVVFDVLPRNLIWVDFVPIAASMGLGFLGSSIGNYLFEQQERKRVTSLFGTYLEPAVVKQLLTNPGQVHAEGESRDMTIMFTDLAGFTSISEGMDAATLFSIMNEYLARVTEVVTRHGGTLDKYIGDAVMAFWNAPTDQPDHALRGCLTAIDSQAALLELKRRYPVLDMRVGVNSGTVKVGSMGTEQRKNYTVMGDAVNLASRLEGANKNYHSHNMIGDDTYQQVVGKVIVRPLDLLRVKGKSKPVPVYELICRPEQLDEAKRKLLLQYERGMEAWRARDWAAALREFQAALALDPTDGPSEIYVERCREFLNSPPPGDWDGVTILTSK